MQADAIHTASDPRSSGGIQDPAAATIIDATMLSLCTYENLMKLVDFKKVRAMLEREVERAGDGQVHLTPLFVYLWALAKPWYATGDVMACVREISTTLAQRGVKVRLPDAYRFPDRPREASRVPETRMPIGTRAGDRRNRSPRPIRDV